MLYLEDYLEMIELLPQNMRARLTELREMDIQIQRRMEELEKRVKQFFSECKRYPPNELPDSIESEYKKIREEYSKSLEEADEKVQLANQMYELVDKFLRQLDTELHKFKCELEADNKGITEVLEKRSLELDNQIVPPVPSVISQQQKENRFETNSSSFRYSRPPRGEKRRESGVALQAPLAEKRQALIPSSVIEGRYTPTVTQPQSVPVASQSQSSVSYNLSHIGAGPAIAAAASQAIAATQQMQQGRRTASLKASYEAINTGGHGHEFGIGRELAGAAQTAIQAIQQDSANNKKKQKKWSGSTAGVSNTSTSSAVQVMLHTPLVTAAPESPTVELAAQNSEATDGEWTYDPNEPRYCLCNQVSYGDMVACDNEDCAFEWFHYPCVGITAPPKGKWYCPQCTQSMKRRGGRK